MIINRRNAGGFTLIELIIAVTIVIILAALAIPNYRGHVLRSNRGDAMAALMRIAAEQEKFYMQNNTYTAVLGPAGLNVGTLSANQHYTLAVTTADATGFDASATPVAGGAQGDDSQCTGFGIDEQGLKTATDGSGDTTAICWR